MDRLDTRDIELRPCPFCGCTKDDPHGVTIIKSYQTGAHQVICQGCNIYTDWYDTAEEAAGSWNRRTREE